eukprot:5066786-Lingulodinium_polyedra.AAC.1
MGPARDPRATDALSADSREAPRPQALAGPPLSSGSAANARDSESRCSRLSSPSRLTPTSSGP